MAEAILNVKAKGRVEAASAGSRPAVRVNRYALETLREFDIPWSGHSPRSVAGLEREPWDYVITVCDRAKESCPIFPGRPAVADWSLPDPAEVEGGDAAQRAAVRNPFLEISRLVPEWLAVPAL